MPAWRREPDGLRLVIRLTPKAAQDRIDGSVSLADGSAAIAARVRAVPEDGKANAALLRLLADTLDIPRSALQLVRGDTARLKEVSVEGDPAALLDTVTRLWPESRQPEGSA